MTFNLAVYNVERNAFLALGRELQWVPYGQETRLAAKASLHNDVLCDRCRRLWAGETISLVEVEERIYTGKLNSYNLSKADLVDFDPYLEYAKKLWPGEEITPDKRRQAKKLAFSSCYIP